MTRFLGAALATAVVFAGFGPARADDKDAKAILEKAIKALGGEEKLAKVERVFVESQGHDQFRRQ